MAKMKAKIITLMVLVILFTIFVSQNSADLTINILFWKLELPGILLLLLTGLFGIIIGIILALIFSRVPKETENEKLPSDESDNIYDKRNHIR
jgi:uncharacterized integral membrane protein